MEKTEIRAVIKFYYLKGRTATQIKTKLDAVLGDKSPSFKTVYLWHTKFKNGRTCCEDQHRIGRPKDVTNEAMIEKIHKIVVADSNIKVREISKKVGISSERVHNILHQYLDMNKDSAGWVPRLITLDTKRIDDEPPVE